MKPHFICNEFWTRTLILGLALNIQVACTEKPQPPPSYARYMEDTDLMLKICNKFAFEPDAKKLNKAAVATQMTKAVGCSNFNGECDLYGKFLSKTIEATEDGIVSPKERKELELLLNQLTTSVKEGREKLIKISH